MNLYAMLKNNKVIDVIFSEEKPQWPVTNSGVPIVAIACEGSVEIGMIYDDEAEKFSFPVPVKTEAIPTQLDRIEEKIQTNEDLQTFYDDVMKEVGL